MLESSIRQALENSAKEARCDRLQKTVPGSRKGWSTDRQSLYNDNNERKYLNGAERERVIAAAETLKPSHCLFALVLAYTGARVSEVLALTPASVQVEAGIITFVTLKRRKHCVREVFIPLSLASRLDEFFALRRLQQSPAAFKRLWPFCRQTAWRYAKELMRRAAVSGIKATCRGLRHAFGVAALMENIALPLIQKWMGHARLSTTAIYTSVSGPEERSFAMRMWRSGDHTRGLPQAIELPQCA